MVPSKGLKHWIIGNTFLKGYYTIFDEENKRIGIAASINYGNPLKASSGAGIFAAFGAVTVLGGVLFAYYRSQDKKNNPATFHLL